MRSPSVFISYSRPDGAWKDRLLRHLSVSLDPETLEAWDDTRIPAGSRWEKELRKAMREARLAVLLISADYLSSRYVREVEVPFLLARNKKEDLTLLPILVRPCAWKTVPWIADKQLLPGGGRALSGGSNNDIEVDLARITEEIHRHFDKAAA